MKVLELQTETEKELAAVAAELAIENRRLRMALNAELEKENAKYLLSRWKVEPKSKVSVSVEKKFPTLDPMAVDPRSVV